MCFVLSNPYLRFMNFRNSRSLYTALMKLFQIYAKMSIEHNFQPLGRVLMLFSLTTPKITYIKIFDEYLSLTPKKPIELATIVPN